MTISAVKTGATKQAKKSKPKAEPKANGTENNQPAKSQQKRTPKIVEKPNSTSTQEPLLRLSRFCKSEHRIVDRRKLIAATYNPRSITSSAKVGLRHSVQDHGLLGGIVWNEATGNVVAGHQRLEITDELEGTKAYLIGVEVINEPDLRKEKAINIALNNPNIQGEYSVESLLSMYSAGEFDLDSTGFNQIDLEQMAMDAGLETEYLDSIFTDAGHNTVIDLSEHVESVIDQVDAIKRKEKSNEKQASVSRESAEPASPDANQKRQSEAQLAAIKLARSSPPSEHIAAQREANFHISLVFPSDAQKIAFCDALGKCGDITAFDGPTIARMLNITLPELPKPKTKQSSKRSIKE